MTDREAMQQALEALERGETQLRYEAIAALTAALAEPEQEPVAYYDPQERGFYWAKPTKFDVPVSVTVQPLPLYTAPTPRKTLTDEELDALRQDARGLNFVTLREFRVIARAVEAAHGIIGDKK